jgi:hypothetical protein
MKRLLLISSCFVLTFLLGGTAGWLLKPVSPEVAAPVAASVPNTNGLASLLGERLFTELNSALAFTPGQQVAIRPLCEEWGTQATANGHRPRLNLVLFERYVPRIRAQLTTNQLARYDEYVAEARTRAQRRANAGGR